jgi:hypothetical protein
MSAIVRAVNLPDAQGSFSSPNGLSVPFGFDQEVMVFPHLCELSVWEIRGREILY